MLDPNSGILLCSERERVHLERWWRCSKYQKSTEVVGHRVAIRRLKRYRKIWRCARQTDRQTDRHKERERERDIYREREREIDIEREIYIYI